MTSGRGGRPESGQPAAQCKKGPRTHRGQRPTTRLPPLNGGHVHGQRFGQLLLRQGGGLPGQLQHEPGDDTRCRRTLTAGQRSRPASHRPPSVPATAAGLYAYRWSVLPAATPIVASGNSSVSGQAAHIRSVAGDGTDLMDGFKNRSEGST